MDVCGCMWMYVDVCIDTNVISSIYSYSTRNISDLLIDHSYDLN